MTSTPMRQEGASGAAPGATPSSLLTVNNVEVIYDEVILVLRGLSLEVPEGQIVALLGSNGAGKSTTLKAISGLLPSERGEITEREFARRLEERLHDGFDLQRLRELYFELLEPNAPMIEFVGAQRERGLRTALLTNNVREWEPLWRPMLAVDEIFETVVDSAFVGCRKPESRIYRVMLDRLAMPAEACLFVDDVEVNCEGARKAGMSAIHFQDNEQAISEIRATLEVAA